MISTAGDRPLAFLITAAGSGTRMGSGIKKEFRSLNGKPVLSETLEIFLKTGIFSYGLITCKPGSQEEVKHLIARSGKFMNTLKKPILLCDGGTERQQSVLFGLEALAQNFPELSTDGFVLIHDGARPWASADLIRKIAEGSVKYSACAPIIPSIDAMKEINPEGIITGHLPRKETVGIQTPQGFAFNEILNAHRRAEADGRYYIDDTEIFSRYEGDVYTIKGSIENKKITYPADLAFQSENTLKETST